MVPLQSAATYEIVKRFWLLGHESNYYIYCMLNMLEKEKKE